jgi:O-antigen/teichoic acid export membrane protein
MYLQFAGGGVNIGLNFWLIPKYGIFGAAFSTMITFFLIFVLGYFISKKYCFFVEFDWKSIVSLFVIFFGLNFVFNYYLQIDSKILLVLKGVTYIGVLATIVYRYLPFFLKVLVKKVYV